MYVLDHIAISILEATGGSFALVPGRDKKLYELLYKLYHPFLMRQHMNANTQYTILDKTGKRIGVLSRGRSDFIQLALIPELRGSGVSEKALTQFVKKNKMERVNWATHWDNYPSLYLLDRLNGGIFEACLNLQNKEGFYRPGGSVPDSMRDTLKKILPKAKTGFKTWEKKVAKRVKEKKELTDYVNSKDYVGYDKI